MTVPGLTTESVAMESITDLEAVRRTLENLIYITLKFRESDKREKLNKCQAVRLQAYQH